MVSFIGDDRKIHLHFILAIFFLLFVRLFNYLKISEFLKQNEKYSILFYIIDQFRINFLPK